MLELFLHSATTCIGKPVWKLVEFWHARSSLNLETTFLLSPPRQWRIEPHPWPWRIILGPTEFFVFGENARISTGFAPDALVGFRVNFSAHNRAYRMHWAPGLRVFRLNFILAIARRQRSGRQWRWSRLFFEISQIGLFNHATWPTLESIVLINRLWLKMACKLGINFI